MEEDRRNRVFLVDKYDGIVTPLHKTKFGDYQAPDDFRMDTLHVGDVYRVVKYDDEGYEVDED